MVVERVLSLPLLVLAAPAITVSAILVKLTSSGPAIYSQERVGIGGRVFRIYKIRSMYSDSERQTGPRWCTVDDPRVTPIGWFLRITHLDELPQLWNVLRGDMSLVGPRPERPEFVCILEKAFPRYRDRLLVPPGITGLAQVQLAPDTDLESVGNKLRCDLYYVQHLDGLLDIKIIVCTVLGVVGVPFAVLRRPLGVPSVDALECSCDEREGVVAPRPNSAGSARAPSSGVRTAEGERCMSSLRNVESPASS